MEVESSAKICTTSHLLRQYAREHRCTESTPSRGKPVLLCSLVHFVSCQVDAVDDCHAARAIELSLANRLGSCSDAVRKVKEVEPVHQNQADTVRKFPTVLSAATQLRLTYTKPPCSTITIPHAAVLHQKKLRRFSKKNS